MVWTTQAGDFYLRIKEFFDKEGLKTVSGDEALYYYHENGVLKGMVSTHVDHFSLAGTPDFVDKVTEEINKTMTVS